jgi:hypothetical protein
MAGLDPAIHVFPRERCRGKIADLASLLATIAGRRVDARVKPGHDDF